MDFWNDLSPGTRKLVYIGVAVLLGLLSVRFFMSSPDAGVTQQRGIAGH